MKVIYGLGATRFAKTAVAIGIFDGVHRGHQLLIRTMVAEAKRLKAKSLIVTFFPHPAHVLRPDIKLPYLMSLDQRLGMFKQLGVDAVAVIPFNRSFAHINPVTFIEKTLVGQLGARAIVVGEDFRFGKDRSGDILLFKKLAVKLGYRMHAIKAVKQAGAPISSSRLRRLISEGHLVQAEKLLGRAFAVSGEVVKGDGRGRQLGYPTANVKYSAEVLPPLGVYAVRVQLGKTSFQGMANLGIRPSFKSENSAALLEVNIFNFRRKIYGRSLTVEFVAKIRDEQKFPSKEALIAQIAKDEIRVRRLLQVE